MYEVTVDGKSRLEVDACGIGFVASLGGVANRSVLDTALQITNCFDHRGAPGHGAGMQVEIPWELIKERFPDYAAEIDHKEVALAVFFMPWEATQRQACIAAIDRLTHLAGADVLEWANVPMQIDVLPAGSKAMRKAPRVKMALIKRPAELDETGWFVLRYLIRLALDREIGNLIGDEFSVVSLSNRTMVYKGLVELSRLQDLYPDLQDPRFATRYVLFHSRYSTNTSTAWRRAQPFWVLAHNGEINTIQGNVAWMKALGQELLQNLISRYPSLSQLVIPGQSIICSGGSDTANMDDMTIALVAGGMSLTQALLALMPDASPHLSPEQRRFFDAMGVYLGACDGPAAIVACDGSQAVAHLDRNGLRPLWVWANDDYVITTSELTGSFPPGAPRVQRILGPGETVSVNLESGHYLLNEAIQAQLPAFNYPPVEARVQTIQAAENLSPPENPVPLIQRQAAFGMTREDIDVVLSPLASNATPAVGSMGDDTPPAAFLDALPRRLEDYFTLRFAQETSPPIDPIRDAWVFDFRLNLGDRSGLWDPAAKPRPLYQFPSRLLDWGHVEWLLQQRTNVHRISLSFPAEYGEDGLEERLDNVVEEAITQPENVSVLVLDDRTVNHRWAVVPVLRAVSRIHAKLAAMGQRQRYGIVALGGVWDIHHVALLLANGADAVCPWLGLETVGESGPSYLRGLEKGVIEAMSMAGVTPSAAYCGSRLIEAIGLDATFLAEEFPGVPCHLGGITRDVLDHEWLGFHAKAFTEDLVTAGKLADVGEFRHTKDGRPHANNADVVRLLHSATGYTKKIHKSTPGTYDAYRDYSDVVESRPPITVLDCLEIRPGTPIPLDEVEDEALIAWRFLAPGMSEGALSEPAHRTLAAGLNVLRRYCRIRAKQLGLTLGSPNGPLANSGEGGFSPERMRMRDGNRSVQYAGGRFTITPFTAATAEEAEIKFAQGAKPGKGGQLPGKKVSRLVAQRRGCEPGYELVSPPVNHNMYSIEDVKLMLEAWRQLNPNVNASVKFVATYGIEPVVMGGVNAGANRLHISDGCGGTGAAKRVDQKHAGVPVAVVLPGVQEALVEEEVRHRVEVSVDGGIQTGQHALKLILLGADRIGFGTSLLIAIGCSMLRKCHLAGPDPADPSGKRRLGCTPGVATQDPLHLARFSGRPQHVARYLWFVAREMRELMAEHGIRQLNRVVGRRDRLRTRRDLTGKASQVDFSSLFLAPSDIVTDRQILLQSEDFRPTTRAQERELAERVLFGDSVDFCERLTNADRCVGVRAAGVIARRFGDTGLTSGLLSFQHKGTAGHYYAAYALPGLEFRLKGSAGDSVLMAAIGGTVTVVPPFALPDVTLVGNAFAYGARGGRAFIAGRAGNRFGICLRKGPTGGPTIVVEGIAANGCQYMTGGVVMILGTIGPNFGAGMTGGRAYVLDLDPSVLNRNYVAASPLSDEEWQEVSTLLHEHVERTSSERAQRLLETGARERFSVVRTCLQAEDVD